MFAAFSADNVHQDKTAIRTEGPVQTAPNGSECPPFRKRKSRKRKSRKRKSRCYFTGQNYDWPRNERRFSVWYSPTRTQVRDGRSHPNDYREGEASNMQPNADMQFKVGDKAVYPAQGVAEVVDIEEKDIGGSRQQFYVLRILDTDRKIMVPVKNANAVGLRQVISEQEIQEIFDILRERTLAFDNQTWNRRYRGFMDKIKTGSIYDVAEVLRDLYRLKTDKQLSFGERRMLDTARTLIVKEIAIARKQTEENVKNEIEAIFFTN